jgi:hypothetical protein
VRPTLELLIELLARRDAQWAGLTAPDVFGRMAQTLPALAGRTYRGIPAHGIELESGEDG